MSREERSESGGSVKVETLNPRSRGINTVVKVVSKSEVRNVTGRGGPHTVADALVGDETGCLYLTLWDDTIGQIDEDETISITNGYVNLFRGNMRLNIGRYGSFEVLEESPIEEVNTENNLSLRQYEQERRPYRPRYEGRRDYSRRRY
jgi:replication factor A1